MAMMDIDAGRLTARLVLERPEAVEDVQGGAETGFVELSRVWALIEPRSFAEDEKGPGLVATVTHHVTVRARGDLAVGQRFRKGGQVFDTLELGMIAAARGYGVSMGDLLMVAEDVAQGRLSLPWPTAVASGLNYYLVWPKTRPGGERLRRLSDFLQGEVRAMELPAVARLS